MIIFFLVPKWGNHLQLCGGQGTPLKGRMCFFSTDVSKRQEEHDRMREEVVDLKITVRLGLGFVLFRDLLMVPCWRIPIKSPFEEYFLVHVLFRQKKNAKSRSLGFGWETCSCPLVK